MSHSSEVKPGTYRTKHGSNVRVFARAVVEGSVYYDTDEDKRAGDEGFRYTDPYGCYCYTNRRMAASEFVHYYLPVEDDEPKPIDMRALTDAQLIDLRTGAEFTFPALKDYAGELIQRLEARVKADGVKTIPELSPDHAGAVEQYRLIRREALRLNMALTNVRVYGVEFNEAQAIGYVKEAARIRDNLTRIAYETTKGPNV